MRINLIPKDLRPTRPSPVPYMPLGGLVLLSVIWLVTQFAAASGARGKYKEYQTELGRISGQLGRYKELPGRLAHAGSEHEMLQQKAAAVTLLTRRAVICSTILQAFAETASPALRLTAVSVDFAVGTVTLSGYGSEQSTDVAVANFLRSLNTNRAILAAFTGAELNHCTHARRGDRPVKEFSIRLNFRQSAWTRPAQAAE